ncbi:MAG: MFS transporter [Novosphingobium sp.]|nr:MFS transporter [Novosphingobium sp.]
MKREAPVGGYAWYVVGTLLIAWTLAYLDRQAITLLIPSLKADLHLSDTQVSLVQGLAFALFFALAGLPIGRLVDRANRRTIIAIGTLVWSLATIACGFAENFAELFVARMGVGVGEACLAPAGYSLLADYFTGANRGRAAGIVGAGGPLGNALSSVLSGWLIERFGAGGIDVPLVGNLAAWQFVFIAFGLPGLVVSLLVLTIREPKRQEAAADLGVQHASFPKYAMAHKSVFIPVYAALACQFISGYAIVSWGAVLLMRVNKVPPGEVGAMFGMMLLIAGVGGSAASGVISDILARRRPLDGRLRLAWFAYPPIIIGYALFVVPADTALTFAAITWITLFSGAYTTASYPMLTDLAPNEMRGQAVAVYMLVGNLAGLGLTPTLVALATDYLYRDETMIRQSIVTVGLPASTLALVLSIIALRHYAAMRREVFGVRA